MAFFQTHLNWLNRVGEISIIPILTTKVTIEKNVFFVKIKYIGFIISKYGYSSGSHIFLLIIAFIVLIIRIIIKMLKIEKNPKAVYFKALKCIL